MRKFFSLFLACVPLPAVAQHQNSQSFEEAREALFEHHGNTTQYLLMADRFEQVYTDGEDSFTWDLQGWIGKDLQRLWVKTEGHDDGDNTEGELQLLYSQAFTPFQDWQLGVRHATSDGDDRSYLVAGIQGLAPYWFETDAAFFISENGDISTRLELEYELFLTQRLILQPRLELDYAFSDDLTMGTGQGLNEVNAGLRLRYEWHRTFAPYLGLEWSSSHGETADLIEASGNKTEEFSLVAGLRFWY